MSRQPASNAELTRMIQKRMSEGKELGCLRINQAGPSLAVSYFLLWRTIPWTCVAVGLLRDFYNASFCKS